MWDPSAGWTKLVCSEVTCPQGSQGSVPGFKGRDGASGCVVDPGYSGKATVLETHPWVNSTISAVPCPAGSTGIVPGTDGTGGNSGCTTDNSFTGTVEATDTPPYFISTLCAQGETCCKPGEYSNGASCEACAAGKYNSLSRPITENVPCTECSAGRFQNSFGQASCAKCTLDCASESTAPTLARNTLVAYDPLTHSCLILPHV